jgi:hypothetical protein
MQSSLNQSREALYQLQQEFTKIEHANKQLMDKIAV